MFKEDGNVIHFAAPKGTVVYTHSSLSYIHMSSPLFIPHLVSSRSFSHQPKLATHPPTVHASVPSNTFAIYGNGEDKELTELVPGILNQLGPDSLASLRRLAESYQSMQKKEGAEEKKEGEGGDDDDEIPDLVEGENFEGKVE
jgi:hypothetical protein